MEVSKKYGISTKIQRAWIDQNESFIEILSDSSQSIVQKRRIGTPGDTMHLEAIDSHLISWVKYKNEKGLVVKDKYLFAKVLNIALEENITNFKCSKGYIQRFMKWNNLVSRVEQFLKMPKNWPTYL